MLEAEPETLDAVEEALNLGVSDEKRCADEENGADEEGDFEAELGTKLRKSALYPPVFDASRAWNLQ